MKPKTRDFQSHNALAIARDKAKGLFSSFPFAEKGEKMETKKNEQDKTNQN